MIRIFPIGRHRAFHVGSKIAGLHSIILMLLMLALSSRPVFAQQFSYLHYAVQEGLPSSEVYQAFEDKKGFVWLCTDNGVARFDGKEMRTFNVHQGLADPVIFGVVEDLHDRLWFRSFSGRLSYLENDSIYRYAFNDTIASLCRKSILHSMYVDSVDRVWLGAGEFSGFIDPKGAISIKPTKPHQLYYQTVGPGFIIGNHWPSSLVNSFNIDGHEFALETGKKNYDNQTIKALRWKSDLYICMSNGLFRYDGKTLTRVLSGKDHIVSLSIDGEDHLWVGYRDNGVERYDTRELINPLRPDFLSGKSVTSVIGNNSKGFWLTTLENGAYYIPNILFKNYVLPDGAVITTARPYGNKTLLGTSASTLLMVDNKTLKKIKSKKLLTPSFFTVFVDSRKNIWAATSETVVLDSALNIRNKNLLLQHDFFEKDSIVYGFSRARIVRHTLAGKELGRTNFEKIYRGILSSGPYMLMAGRTGLDVYSDKLNFIKTLDDYKNYKISEILNLNDSLVLVSTSGSGFFVLNKNTWQSAEYTAGKNFFARNIYTALIVDKDLWLGTEEGIAITDIASLVQRHPQFIFIDQQSGLINNKVNLLSYAPPFVWAFTDQGFSVLPKDGSEFRSPEPQFYLKNTLVNEVPVDLGAEKKLSFFKDNVQINFGFISFKNQNIYLRSRLTDDGAWHYSQNRSLNFYSLAPASYNFQLQYSSDMVQWHDALGAIPFTIMPSWWQNIYFQLFIGIVLVAIFVLIYRSQMSALQHKNNHLNALNEHKKNLIQAEIDTLERERSRIAKDLHDGIGMSLTVLKLQIFQLFKRQDGAPNELEENLKNTMQEIRDITYNLAPPGLAWQDLATVLKNYIDRITPRIGVEIELHQAGKKITDPRISLFSFRIIQELLSNSLQHAKATAIEISLQADEQKLKIIYIDNGSGFSGRSKSRGSGLLNIQARTESIDGKIDFKTSENGVRYMFTIPLPEMAAVHNSN